MSYRCEMTSPAGRIMQDDVMDWEDDIKLCHGLGRCHGVM